MFELTDGFQPPIAIITINLKGIEMGQIAEDIVDGFQCSHCGICFIREHGFPVLCTNCFDQETEEERTGLPRATIKEF